MCSFLVRRLKPAGFIYHMESPKMIIRGRCAAARGDFMRRFSGLVQMWC